MHIYAMNKVRHFETLPIVDRQQYGFYHVKAQQLVEYILCVYGRGLYTRTLVHTHVHI